MLKNKEFLLVIKTKLYRVNQICYKHASQYQLFLCAYPHGKHVMPLACERVITCRVHAFTVFLETPWRVTYFQNFTCVFTILVKFDICFLGLP